MPGMLFGRSLERNEHKLKYEQTQTLFFLGMADLGG